MSKKNLNWDVPEALAERFDKIVTDRRGQKRKWVGAVAAILMYLEADEEEQIAYEERALGMTGEQMVRREMAKLPGGERNAAAKGDGGKKTK